MDKHPAGLVKVDDPEALDGWKWVEPASAEAKDAAERAFGSDDDKPKRKKGA